MNGNELSVTVRKLLSGAVGSNRSDSLKSFDISDQVPVKMKRKRSGTARSRESGADLCIPVKRRT